MKNRTLNAEDYAAAEALAARLNAEQADAEGCEALEHPEGAKRGGYVPVFTEEETGLRVMYDNTAEEWVTYDDQEPT